MFAPLPLPRAAKVKRQSKEAVDELTTRSSILAEENRGLKVKLHACLDELDFRNGQVQQLREENTRKWRVEERNDWKSLVDSVQRDRAELQEANEDLQERCEELETEVAELRAELESSRSSSSSSSSSSSPSSLSGGSMRAPPSTPSRSEGGGPGVGLTIEAVGGGGVGGVPTTPTRLQRELQETKRRLESAESERAREKAEMMRLRAELGARREREKWQQSSGLLVRIVRMTRIWQRGPPALPSHAPVAV